MSASCEQESCEQGITLSGDLHARPAGALAVAAGRFASAVSVTAGGQTADAKSVLGVMGLGATSGQHVTVSAAGPDAQEAVAALIAILGEATKVGGLLRNQAGRRSAPAAHPPATAETCHLTGTLVRYSTFAVLAGAEGGCGGVGVRRRCRLDRLVVGRVVGWCG